jgi:hypothetical protein
MSKPFAAQVMIDRCERLLAGVGKGKPPGGIERRKEPRRPFLGQVTVLTERGHPSVTGEVFDISPGGAQIDLGSVPANPFPAGGRLRLEVGLPPSFEPLELEAKVEWRREGTLGVSFAEASEQARQQLKARLARASRR